jgi:hypothetical protein
LAAALLVGGMAVSSTVTAQPAAALCAAPDVLGGDWHNDSPSSRAMARVIVQTCLPIRECSGDICSITHDAGVSLQPFGKCSPTNCDWGRKMATNGGDGWWGAVYDFGFVKDTVWVRPYEYYGLNYLRVWVNNDFTAADGRTDFVTDEWFLR